jgi:Endonuclease-reverse transcriptase
VNLYKPPTLSGPINVIRIPSKNSTLHIGDFNSHHNLWGYESNYDNGEKLVDWAETNNFHLVFNPKDKPTFFSRM